jgi:signal transduction histidine kinase
MTSQERIVDLVQPLASKTSIFAAVAAFLLTLGAPLVLYGQLYRARAAEADSYARRMSDLVRDVVISQPELWTYDTPKLANHLQLLVEGVQLGRVVVISTDGHRIDVPGANEQERAMLRWASAPVFRGQEEVARVWVGVHGWQGLSQVIVVLALAFLLGAALTTILYALPVGVVGGAEREISGLLERLEAAREELSVLNAELEERVIQRSEQLAETAEALRLSEARLREVAGRAVEATEQERQRVARELHDGVGQILTAIRLSLQVLTQLLSPQELSRARVGDLETLVDESIDELRRIAMDLHPAALDRLGLQQGLAEMCSSVATRAGIRVHFVHVELPEALPAAVESSCYRLVQECLTNIVRYAEAENVEVRIENDGRAIEVRVEDDGVGFETSRPSQGLGLRGMEDRTALLGGSLTIESAPGRGTAIRAILPWRAVDKDSSTSDES